MSATPTPDPPTHPRRRLAAQAAILALVLTLLAWRTWPSHQLRVIFLETEIDHMRVLGVLIALLQGHNRPKVQMWVQCGS